MPDIFEIRIPIETKIKEEVITKFSAKQGGKFFIFSHLWECFVWAATIGFLRNERRSLSSPKERIFSLNTMRNGNGEKDVQALICMCIAREGNLEIMKNPDDAINIIAEYANGGFYHIKELIENGENTFNDFEKVKQEIFSRNYNPLEQDRRKKQDSPDEENDEDSETSITNNPFLKIIEQEDESSVDSAQDAMQNDEEKGYTISNSSTRSTIQDKTGNVVFAADGIFKYLRGKLYRLNLKDECFTLKRMDFDGSAWMKGGKKIVSYPQTELYKILDNNTDYAEIIEDIIDDSAFENCRLKVKGVWYNYKGNLVTDELTKTESSPSPSNETPIATSDPSYERKRQAILKAMETIRVPTEIHGIANRISRTSWGETIKDEDVEKIIKTLPEVKSSEGKYILKR